ncbi:MAG: hypothetical protein P1U63_08010 [Coxiellaceae bacterium]|nr:hypothetical protein [Coxiellaceae bacterium]
MSRRSLYRTAIGICSAWWANEHRAHVQTTNSITAPPPSTLTASFWLISPAATASIAAEPIPPQTISDLCKGFGMRLLNSSTPQGSPKPITPSNPIGSILADAALPFNWHLPSDKAFRNLPQWLTEANDRNYQLRELTPTNLAECIVFKLLIGETVHSEDFTITRGKNTCCAEFHFIEDTAGLFEIPHNADDVMALLKECSELKDELKNQLHDKLQAEFDNGRVADVFKRILDIDVPSMKEAPDLAAHIIRLQTACQDWLAQDALLHSTPSCR